MSSESDAKNPLRAFTHAGRVLVVISMIFGGVIFYLSVEHEFFSAGFYSLLVLLLPGFGGALALFCVGCVAYKLLGVKVWAVPVDRDATQEKQPRLSENAPNEGPDA
jgi:Ni,Fe-hydrogenase I cytochrome b subunit